MVKNHLKSLNAPKSWPIHKKENVWVARPNPGAHKLKEGISLLLAMKELLKYAKTKREVRHILNNKIIEVDGKRRKDLDHLVGLMDVITAPDLKESHRVLFNSKGKLIVHKIDDAESKLKISRITGKTLLKGKMQLNTSDSRNIFVDKDDYKVGDSLLIELPSQKIKAHLKLEKGAMIYLTGGKHIGSVGNIESLEGKKLTFKTNGEVYETLNKFAFVVGKDKPVLTLLKNE